MRSHEAGAGQSRPASPVGRYATPWSGWSRPRWSPASPAKPVASPGTAGRRMAPSRELAASSGGGEVGKRPFTWMANDHDSEVPCRTGSWGLSRPSAASASTPPPRSAPIPAPAIKQYHESAMRTRPSAKPPPRTGGGGLILRESTLTQIPPGIEKPASRQLGPLSGHLKRSPLPLGAGSGVRARVVHAGEATRFTASSPHPNPLPKGEGSTQRRFRMVAHSESASRS